MNLHPQLLRPLRPERGGGVKKNVSNEMQAMLWSSIKSHMTLIVKDFSLKRRGG
jgi:hypothetical protein